MLIEKEYKVNNNIIYNYVYLLLLNDYNSNTTRKVKKLKKGAAFNKYFGNNSARVVVKELKSEEYFITELHTNRGITEIKYHFISIDEDTTKIIYSEKQIQQSFFNKMNTALLMPFFKKKFLKQMEQRLDLLVTQTILQKEKSGKE